MNSLEEQFQTSLKTHKLIKKKERVWIACSAGPDSVALFYLMNSVAKEWDLKLGLIHFNHQIRGKESNQDEQFVKQLAKKHRIPFYSGKAKVAKLAQKDRSSLEEAARLARYDFFCKLAKKKKVKKILTAHCLDDQAETVLMRILKGTGVTGLRGIRSKMTMQGIVFARPLLDFRKKEILAFAKKNKIKFRKDKSNQSKKILRNWLRLDLIPQLQDQLNPRIVETLARVPSIVEEESQLLEEVEKQAWKAAYKGRGRGKVFLNREPFLELKPTLQFRVLNRALRRLDTKSGLSFDAWKRLRPHLKAKGYRCSLPRDIDFHLTPLKIDIYKK